MNIWFDTQYNVILPIAEPEVTNNVTINATEVNFAYSSSGRLVNCEAHYGNLSE